MENQHLAFLRVGAGVGDFVKAPRSEALEGLLSPQEFPGV